ncbi:hypothetical protein BGZ73_008400, partial [Actinomortierella ambigua]
MHISSPDLLQTDLGHLVNNESRHDIKILVGKDKVTRYGHSLILAARCPYFDAALRPHWKEFSNGVFVKPNIEPDVFDLILQYLYTGQLTMSVTVVPALIEAAQELQLAQLALDCEATACMAINADTVFSMISIAYQHGLDKLWSSATEFLDIEARTLLQRDDLLTLEQDFFIQLLSRESMVVDELSVWKAIIRYVYRKNGMDYNNCPLLKFPVWPGRMIIRAQSQSEADRQEHGFQDGKSTAASFDDTASIEECLRDTTFEEIHSKDVVVDLSQEQFECLRTSIKPFLLAIRFTSLKLSDFARCMEGTGLIPADLCRRVYRYHALPADYPNSLAAPRCQGSTLMSRALLSELASWVMGAVAAENGYRSSPRQIFFRKLFKASEHGFDSKTFHARCDNQGRTVTVVCTSKDSVVGGYNETDWTSDSTWSHAINNFLFVTNRGSGSIFKYALDTESCAKAARNCPGDGPTFGTGFDLGISE